MKKMRIAALIASVATLGLLAAGCSGEPAAETTAPATTGGTATTGTTGSAMSSTGGDSKMATPPGPGAGK